MSEPDSTPILNGPYDQPISHYRVGNHGRTDDVLPGRRPTESLIPIAAVHKGRKSADGLVQEEIDFDITRERRERNRFVNDLRREVDRWRVRGFERVTPTTRKLLEYWSDPERGTNRVLFCQRDAVETAIFLAGVACRHGYADRRRRVAEQNEAHNNGLPRIALRWPPARATQLSWRCSSPGRPRKR